MLKQRLFYFCLFILMSYFVTAQELRCNISVSSQKIQGTNRELFTNMQRDMYEFLNNKRWSENIFQYDERIECSIQITLDEQIGSDQFRGSMQVRVSRPDCPPRTVGWEPRNSCARTACPARNCARGAVSLDIGIGVTPYWQKSPKRGLGARRSLSLVIK